MKNLVSEFEAITAAYDEVGKKLMDALKLEDSQNSRPLIQSILKSHDSLAQIEQMNARVLRVSSEWKKSRESVDSRSWDEINRCAEKALRQAERLNQLCTLTEKKIRSAREKLMTELTEVGKGARYLRSAAPPKNNYPKFIDSMY